jgi:hypothetical protein
MTYPIDPTSPEYAQYVGFATEENPVADAENYYLSSEGVTYRWFKGARFWDEVIVSTQDPGASDPACPVGGEGAGYPPAPGGQGPQGAAGPGPQGQQTTTLPPIPSRPETLPGPEEPQKTPTPRKTTKSTRATKSTKSNYFLEF